MFQPSKVSPSFSHLLRRYLGPSVSSRVPSVSFLLSFLGPSPKMSSVGLHVKSTRRAFHSPPGFESRFPFMSRRFRSATLSDSLFLFLSLPPPSPSLPSIFIFICIYLIQFLRSLPLRDDGVRSRRALTLIQLKVILQKFETSKLNSHYIISPLCYMQESVIDNFTRNLENF